MLILRSDLRENPTIYECSVTASYTKRTAQAVHDDKQSVVDVMFYIR
jgi:hypothetical protein